MELEIKIGAVFSLATDEVQENSAEENSHKAADNNDGTEFSQTAVDPETTVNGVTENSDETNSVMTGVDPEMNSSTGENDLDIDVENDLGPDGEYSPDVDADNPPVLPMEDTVGVLSSVYTDEMEEAIPPPVLSPVIEGVTKPSGPRVKEEPVEYEGN